MRYTLQKAIDTTQTRILLGSFCIGLMFFLTSCSNNSLGLPACAIEATDIYPTKRALLTFQACRGTKAECDTSNHYEVWLAESDDLRAWTLVPNWIPFEMPGVDFVSRSDVLYFYGEPGVYRTLDLEIGGLSCAQSIDLLASDGSSMTDAVYEIRPQVRVSDNRIVLSYMPKDGAAASDPRTCTFLPCTRTIRTAVETTSGLGARFLTSDGDRLSLPLTEESSWAFNTDWITGSDSNGYILTVSRSDDSFQVYAASALEGSYSSLGVVNGKGSSPALAFDGENYWFFADSVDEETPQNRVVKIYGSTTLTGLTSASLYHVFEGLDLSDSGTNPIQVKEASVLLLE